MTLEGDATVWAWRVDDALSDGLAPGQTATIEVTLTPCPDAPLDPTACPTGPVGGTLVVTDDSTNAGARIELTAVAVLPAKASVRCPSLDMGAACNAPDAALDRCGRLDFGTNLALATCELFVELEAERRGGATGPLEVLDAQILVRDLESADTTLVDGRDVGFGLTTETPFLVLLDQTRRLNVTTDYLKGGTWVGVPGEGGGLRIRTNDPANAEIVVPIFATGVPPNFVYFGFLNFEPEHRRQERTLSLENVGGPTQITSIEIEPAVFSWSSAEDPYGPIGQHVARDTVTLDIAYDPPDAMPRTGTLRLFNGSEVLVTVRLDTIRDGGVPACTIAPATLSFTTAGERVVSNITVTSDGFADCVVDALDITSPGGTDDFTVDLPACATLPCDPGIRLGNGQTFDIPIAYQNNDASGNDLAQLELSTNDPANPTQIVVLDGTDDACIPPTAVIMRITEDPCVGQPVQVTASASLPGGRMAGGTIVDYRWVVRFGEQVIFVPPNTETTSFTPTAANEVIIALEIENSCGAVSTGGATESVRVQSMCP